MAFVLGAIVGAIAVKSVPVLDRAATVARDWLAERIRSIRIPPGQSD